MSGYIFFVRGIDFASFCEFSIGFWKCSDSEVFWGFFSSFFALGSINVGFVSTTFQLDFVNVPNVWYFLFFILFLNFKIKQNFVIVFNALHWYILEDLLTSIRNQSNQK